MKVTKSILTAAALVATFGASAGAQVSGSTTAGAVGPFVSLGGPGACTAIAPCDFGGLGSIVGGTIFTSDQPFADIPAGSVFESRFLSAGPTSTEPSTISLLNGASSIGFLWGSPDTYNLLEVLSTVGTFSFDVANLGFAVTNGNQNFSQYVRFDADPNVFIVGLRFFNNPARNAFEVANFSVSAGGNQVPEPASFALVAVGMLGVAGVARRRKVGAR